MPIYQYQYSSLVSNHTQSVTITILDLNIEFQVLMSTYERHDAIRDYTAASATASSSLVACLVVEPTSATVAPSRGLKILEAFSENICLQHTR